MKTKNCLFILSISLFIISCGEKNSNENKYGEVTSEEFKDYAKHFTAPKDSKKYDIEGKLTNGEMSFDSMPNITNKFHAEFDSNLDTSITKDYKLDGNLKFTTESNSDYTIDYYFKLNNSQNDNYSLSVVPSEGKENSYEIDKQTFENNVSKILESINYGYITLTDSEKLIDDQNATNLKFYIFDENLMGIKFNYNYSDLTSDENKKLELNLIDCTLICNYEGKIKSINSKIIVKNLNLSSDTYLNRSTSTYLNATFNLDLKIV